MLQTLRAFASTAPPRGRATSLPAWSRREMAASHGALIAFALVAFGLWLWSGAIVPWDSKNHFYPMFRFLAETLARGEIPLWNPYHFGGHPTVADPQAMLFSPTMVLFALLDPHAGMTAFDGAILAHLLLGGFGVLGLFRRRGWHPAGAVLAAIIFMLGGSASARLQHTGMILSYAFLPLALWALESMLARRTVFSALVFACVAAAMAIGRDQVAFLSCLTLLCAALWQIAQMDRPLRALVGLAPILLLAGLAGALLLAIPSLLTFQLLAESNRPGIPYGVAVTGSLAPINLATLFSPNMFGSLNWDYSYFGPGYETSADPDWTDRNINYLYIGVLPVLLMLWHGIAGRRLFAREIAFFSGLALVAGLYALGSHTPLFELAFDHLPGVSLYRRPADATFLLNVALGMMAGYLLHRYLVDGPPKILHGPATARALAGLLAAMAIPLVILVPALAFSSAQGRLGASVLALLPALLIGAGGAAALLMARQDIRRRALVATGIVLVSAASLVWRNAASSLNAEPAARYSVYGTMTDNEKAALGVLQNALRERLAAGARPRVEVLGLPGPWMNASLMLGLENTIGYNPLRIADYARAIGPGENAGDMNLRQFPGTFRGYNCRLARLLGLEFLVIDRPLSDMPDHMPRPRQAELLYGRDGIFIYRLAPAAPRAYLATHVIAADRETIFDEEELPSFDRSHEALIDESAGSQIVNKALFTQTGEARHDENRHVAITRYKAGEIIIEVESDRAGLLVLHDLAYPGWQATVDGRQTPILPANLLFRGVELEPGRHRVVFTFRPFSPANLTSIVASLIKGRHAGEAKTVEHH